MRICQTIACLGLVLCAPVAGADDMAEELAALRRQVAQLEDRVRAAEDRAAETASETRAAPARRDTRPRSRDAGARDRSWSLSGHADIMHRSGQSDSSVSDGETSVENFGLFFDFDLGWRPSLGNTQLAEGISLHAEWDAVRYGWLANRMGSLYLELEQLGGSGAFNLRFGRMEIPFGEEYGRFSRDAGRNPLLSYSAPAPYNWDSGVMLHGAVAEGRLAYQVALLNGDDGLNRNTQSDPSWVVKLSGTPLPWTRLSVSGFRSGGLGNRSHAAESGLEWGGTHGVPFGSDTSVINFQDGVAIADDPEALRLDGVEAWEADLILSPPGWGHLWLAHGRVDIESGSTATYDRDLRYSIAEAVLELGALAARFEPLYVAVRYSSLGTHDRDRGYVIPAFNAGDELGFNTERTQLWSAGVGLRLQPGLVLKAEYSWSDFDLVRGAGALADQADDKDYFGIGLSVDF